MPAGHPRGKILCDHSREGNDPDMKSVNRLYAAMKIHAIALALLAMLYAHVAGAVAADPMYEVNQLLKKDKKEQALELIDAWLASRPKDAWGRSITQMRFLKGTLLAQLKRNPEAIRVFQKLIQDYPDLPEPYNNLAALYLAQGRAEDARDILERGLHTDAAYATAYRNLNDVYAQLASQAYDHTLQASKGGQPAPALIKDLCDNYSRVANQALGRRQPASAELRLLAEIPKSRTSAGAPPSKVDIDEMAMEAAEEPGLPPAFTNPAVNPAPPIPSVVVPKAGTARTAVAVNPPPAKAAAVPAPAAGQTTPPIQQPAIPETAEQKAVLTAVQSWAASWSRKDASGYLGFYARDFRTPAGQSRGEWAKLRRERIGKPKSIKVTVEAPRIAFADATHASVSFRQGYRSDNLQTSTRKTLIMVKSGSRWLIQEERVGG
jgi:ketosteroid isomerase-like protein